MPFSYNEVEQSNLLYPEVIDDIPSECECGGAILFTDTLNQIYCSNKYCYFKIADRLEKLICDRFLVEGIRFTTCVKIVKYFNMKSPFQIFMACDKIINGADINISTPIEKAKEVLKHKNKSIYLWEYVKYCSIPSIDTNSLKIFGNYDDINSAYEDIEKGQIPFIANKLGISRNNGIMATNIYNNLMEYKDELLFGLKYFDIKKNNGRNVKIAITDKVDGYRSKEEFIKYINNKYEGEYNFIRVNTVTYDVKILIVDGDASHTKYSTALKINESGKGRVIICRSSEIDNILHEIV